MTKHFNPLDAVIRPVDVTYVEGDNLQQIIQSCVKDPIQQNLCQVSIGGIVVPREKWRATRPKTGQIIKVQIIPRGGGFRKVLRTVLTIAVVAVAAWVTGGAAVGLLGAGFAAGTAGAAIAGGLVGVIGQFAINAILPPPSFDRPQQDVQPLYTITNTRNQGRADQAAPLIFGRHRFTFDLLSQQYQQVVGTDTYLVFLCCVGVGNYEVSNIRIGDTPITDFDNVTIQRSLLIDSPRQTLLQGDFTQDTIGINLTDTSTHVRTVPAGTTDIDVVFDFPRGLGTADDRGRPQNVRVGVSVRYRPIGDTDWQSRAPDNGTDADTAAALSQIEVFGRRNFFEHNSGIANFVNGVPNISRNQLTRTFSRSDNQQFRASLRLALPPGPAYEVEVRRTTPYDSDVAVGNDVTWSLLGAWTDEDLTPDPRMSVLAFRIKATDQLSGFVEQLNGDVGKIIPTLTVDNPISFDPQTISYEDWRTETVSENCADILLDAIFGPHTDDPHPASAVNFPNIAAFWQWCHIRNFRFGLPITDDISRAELMDIICNAGRGRPYYYRGQLHVAIDRERLEGPRQVIGPENARNFVFTRSFGAGRDALRVRFNNAENDYREDLITIYRDGIDVTNAVSFDETTLPGEVYPDQVFQKGRYIVDVAERANVIGRCEMDFEVETLQLGDYIRLQHPVLNSAASSGRILETQGQTIILSQRFEMDTALDYVLVHRRIIGPDDDARIEVEGIYDLITAGGETDQVSLANPLPNDVIMKYDDLYVIGIRGEATFEALIQDIRPTGAYEAEVSFLTYLPDALTVPNIPAHTPISTPSFITPPRPIFLNKNVNDDFISILFDIPALSSGLIQNFQCAYRVRRASDTDNDAVPDWIEAAPLTGTARSFRFPITSMAQSYDARIISVDYDGLSSRPLIIEDISFSDFLITPQNVQAFPETRSIEGGAAVPVVRFIFPEIENADLINFVIEHRATSMDELAAYNQIYSGPTSINEIDIHGLLPGAICDFRFAFQHQRGPLTRIDLRPVIKNITIPNSLISSNTAALGDQDAATILSNIGDAIDGVSAAQADISNLFDALGDAQSASESLAAVQAEREAVETARDETEDLRAQTSILRGEAVDAAQDANDAVSSAATFASLVSGIAVNTLPIRLDDPDLYFSHNVTGSPDELPDVTARVGIDPITDAVEGAGLRYSIEDAFTHKGALPYIVGNTYRVRARVREVTPPTNPASNVTLRIRYSDADYTDTGFNGQTDIEPNSDADFYQREWVATQEQFDLGRRWIRGEILFNRISGRESGDGVYEIFEFEFTDETRRVQAQTNAEITEVNAVQTSQDAASTSSDRQDVSEFRQEVADDLNQVNTLAAIVDEQSTTVNDAAAAVETSRESVVSLAAQVAETGEFVQTTSDIIQNTAQIATDAATGAERNFLLSAQISAGALNPNANFADYPNQFGPPPSWSNRTTQNSAVRVHGDISPYAYQLTGGVNRNSAIGRIFNINATGFYQLRATVTLVSGTFEGAALWALVRNEGGFRIEGLDDAAIVFSNDPDSSGSPVGDGVVGQTYTFTKIVHFTNPSIHDIDLRVNSHSTVFGSIADENVIRWHEAVISRASSTDISNLNLGATVEQQAGAIVDLEGRTEAFIQDAVFDSQGGRAVHVLRTVNGQGQAVLGAQEVILVVLDANGDVTDTSTALTLTGGLVQILNAELNSSSITVGNLRLPVAIAPVTGSGQDGDVVSFGGTASEQPDISFDLSALPSLPSGGRYDVRAVNRTLSGFTISAKEISAGSTPVEITDTGDSSGGSGRRVMDKSRLEDSSAYNFRVQGTITVTSVGFNSNNSEFGSPPDMYNNFGVVRLQTQFNNGSGFEDGPVITITNEDVGIPSTTDTPNNGTFNYDVTRQVQWGNAIGQHGGDEFAVKIISNGPSGAGGTLTDLESVRYTILTGGTDSSVTEPIPYSIRHKQS